MGHPDKVADHISDAILDSMLAQDPKSRVACETLVTTGMAVIAGEITTKATVNIPDVVRKTIREIGYNDPELGFDGDNCAVIVSLDRQSPDISQGVTQGQGLHKEQGAGDQGIMFGFATQRDSRIYADADLACARNHEQIGTNASKEENPVAAAGWKEPGHGGILS